MDTNPLLSTFTRVSLLLDGFTAQPNASSGAFPSRGRSIVAPKRTFLKGSAKMAPLKMVQYSLVPNENTASLY